MATSTTDEAQRMTDRRTLLSGLGLSALGLTGLAGSSALAQTPVPVPAATTLAPPVAPAPPPAGAVRFTLNTEGGPIVADLFADKAPITVANFLRYLDHKLYDGGEFYRAVKVAESPLFGLVQWATRKGAVDYKPIAHESTLKTGLTHSDGTLSMAAAGPGMATSGVFVCVGDASLSLDANPKERNEGYAAFGRVVSGMDVVRTILIAPTSPTAGSAAMKGQILVKPVKILTARRTA
jgi:peptidyl-prolyl cis-trans isomerase A (cyclophilin A)